MRLAVLWGWDGVLGSILALVFGLVIAAVAVVQLREAADRRQPGWHVLARTSAMLALLAIGACVVLVSAVAFWGAFDIRIAGFQVAHREEDATGQTPSYIITDTDGHRYSTSEEVYGSPHTGEQVQCRVTTPCSCSNACWSAAWDGHGDQARLPVQPPMKAG